jgi:hypothetical protein
MRFVSLVRGTVSKARRAVSQGLSLGIGHKTNDKEMDAAKLAEQLRQVMTRLNLLESQSSGEPVEFEVVVGDHGARVELVHNLSGPVRWYVTSWLSAASQPTAGHSLVQDQSSTANTLYLLSYTAGRAVIRVEPSKFYIPVTST